MENKLTFDQLPQVVAMLTKEVSEVKQILLQKSNKQADVLPEQFLTIQEAAEFLSLKVSTLYSMVSKGTIPVMKRSKRLYFSRNQLIDFLKEGQKKTYSELEKEAQSHINIKK